MAIRPYMEMELATRALVLLSLALAALLHHAITVAGDAGIGGFSLRLVPSPGWNNTVRVNDNGFLQLLDPTALRPHVHPPRSLTYSVAVTVGTDQGRHTYSLVLDTASSITWMQCAPLQNAFPQQPAPFNPSASPSYRHLPPTNRLCLQVPPGQPHYPDCRFHDARIEDPAHYASGVLGTDTFVSGADHVQGVTFGCAHHSTGFQSHGVLAGVLGLGKQEPSLLLKLGGHRFSYCLFGHGHQDRHGFLKFGTDVPATDHMKSTKILFTRFTVDQQFSAYFIPLVGISVAGHKLEGADFAKIFRRRLVQGNKGRYTSGCAVDPGTSTMVMIQPAYNILERGMAQRVAALGLPRVHRSEFGLCFRATGAAFAHLPRVILHMESGDNLMLGPRKLFMQVSQDMCLAVVPSEHITIIGAMQQVDTRFVYDLADSTLYFANENCEADTAPHD